MTAPSQLQTIAVRPGPKKKREGWMARHGDYPKGTVLPETNVQACPRKKVSDFPPGFIPPRYYERNLEQNQLLAHCCRHPENHEIEARKSHPDEQAPDIYIFWCQCGRKHVRFFIGEYDREGERRPVWK
jgi:hypothetical protein